jgi:hypothetical protein
MTEPRIIDPPDRIHLTAGNISHDIDFPEAVVRGVDWIEARAYDADVAYVRADAVREVLEGMERYEKMVGDGAVVYWCWYQLRELVGGEG